MKYIIIPTIVFNLVCLSIFISRQYKKYHTRKSNYIHYIETIKAKIIKEIENTSFYTSTDPEINISAKNILVFHFSMEACQPYLEEISETIKSEFPNYTKNKYIIFFSNDIENRLRKNFLGKQITTTVKIFMTVILGIPSVFHVVSIKNGLPLYPLTKFKPPMHSGKVKYSNVKRSTGIIFIYIKKYIIIK